MRYKEMQVNGIDPQAHTKIFDYLMHDPINAEKDYVTFNSLRKDEASGTLTLGFSVRDVSLIPEAEIQERNGLVKGLMDLLSEAVFGAKPNFLDAATASPLLM